MGGAAELFTRHVFLDLETTGLDPRADEIIELGCLFFENGREVDRFARLYSASRPLPLTIRRLTGLTDADLAGRPRFGTDIEELRSRLTGWTVVAHNAPFEKGFLPDLLGPIRAPVLDSCELMHYLHPELTSHSLESLLRWAGLGIRQPHRALSDCEAVHAVLVQTMDRFVREGRGEDVSDLLATLDPRAARRLGPPETDGGAFDYEEWPLLELLSRLSDACRAAPASLALETQGFLRGKPERRRAAGVPSLPEPETDAPVLPVRADEVTAVLGAGGALERMEEGFRSRPAQLEMAHAVARALSDGEQVAVEAGTGTGKSLAYLAPAALFAARNGRKVGVAPHTKTLQDQLLEKDLPRLHKAMGGTFGYALLKGQSNYLCRRRALEATRVEPGMGHSARAPRAYLRAYLRRSVDGDMDRLSHWFRERFPVLMGLTPAVRSEAATTLGEKCPHYHRCFYHSAVAQAREADVLVINQSLAFAWPARYPKLEHLVLDEAHEVEDVATTALTVELSDLAFQRLTERLHGRDGRHGLFAELRRALSASRREESRALMGQVEDALRRLMDEARDLGSRVTELCEPSATTAGEDPDEGAYAPELRVTEAVRALPTWEPVRDGLELVRGALQALHTLLAVRVLEALPELAARMPALERELSGATTELGELATLAQELSGEAAAGRCYSATAEPRRQRWNVGAQPVDVSFHVSRDFAANKRALVLTSATLGPTSHGSGTPFVLKRLGLDGRGDRPAPRLLRAPSPFQLHEQALVVLVTDAPRAHEDPFVEWAATRISGLAQTMGGRLLGLFASTRRMERVGAEARSRLEPLGIEVLRQSRGHSRSLAARQERDTGTVLLGTKSFWQGVDIPGRGVGCVFIDKLPLEPALRPLVAAREEPLARSGGEYQGFLQYRLPRALLLLRQGVGRLIRSTTDRGVVIVADPGHPSYRAHLMEALEGYRVEALPWAQARLRIHAVLKQTGLTVDVASPP
ncbi:exonuclease [Myxococcus sp. CA051A]|uniref:Exonuclease n=1 Tax=Myxococcus llanfairpwllgwyngyllgogerychwyrndrobwllllantysiliogogogochensis TaxID=2590453 RepID=A0A540WMN9_9BACT|nr:MULTISPECIES: helicase C-terminal domain-containing protein [Myxococcus]NTX33743.1 exonuclease [Myxococcus sp. CA033]NTX59150.1 exonuclease [Myxococcus sp. CA051A]TQF10283.1 exonuclease [Myxococcus llanfairpwllgwyngyllgogerychwyrndrobwllllantysiliogogogochensis]